MLRCACGAELATQPASEAADLEVAFAHELSVRLQEAEEPSPTPSPHLRSLNLEQLLHLAGFLGAYATRSNRTGCKPQKIDGLARLDVARDVVMAAAKALLIWPDGLEALLASLASTQPDLGKRGRLQKQFGYFYQGLYRSFPEPAYAFVTEAFERYLTTHWQGQLAARHRRLSVGAREAHAWLPVQQAARALGIRAPSVRRLVEKGVLVGQLYVTENGRTMGTVLRTSLDAHLESREHWVTLTALRARLGLSRKRAHALIARGVLQPLQGPGIDGSSVWMFDLRAVPQSIFPAGQVATACEETPADGQRSAVRTHDPRAIPGLN